MCVCPCVQPHGPSLFSDGFPALCVPAASPQINCRILERTGQHGFPQLFQRSRSPPQRISVWTEAITAHIQSHLSQEPNEGAFDSAPTDAYLHFMTNQVVNSLPCWRWSETLNAGLFAHKRTHRRGYISADTSARTRVLKSLCTNWQRLFKISIQSFPLLPNDLATAPAPFVCWSLIS